MLLWTPPHFWALALLLAPQYEAAKVPMLPVVHGTTATTRRVLAYTVALVVPTLGPGLLGTFGLVYLASAVLLDAVFCVLAWRLWREGAALRAGVLFHYSLPYRALLFVALAVDAVVR